MYIYSPFHVLVVNGEMYLIFLRGNLFPSKFGELFGLDSGASMRPGLGGLSISGSGGGSISNAPAIARTEGFLTFEPN
jgi:hypothetical protein